MLNIKKTFIELINTGVEAIDSISDANNKAIACAELANSIAKAEWILKLETCKEIETSKEIEAEVSKAKKQAEKKSKGKDSLKTGANKGKKKKEETVEEVPQIEEVPQVEEIPQIEEIPQVEEVPQVEEIPDSIIEETWTEENIEKYADYLTYLNQVEEMYGEEWLYGEAISSFSNGVLNKKEDLTPLNIEGFAIWISKVLDEQ